MQFMFIYAVWSHTLCVFLCFQSQFRFVCEAILRVYNGICYTFNSSCLLFSSNAGNFVDFPVIFQLQ